MEFIVKDNKDKVKERKVLYPNKEGMVNAYVYCPITGSVTVNWSFHTSVESALPFSDTMEWLNYTTLPCTSMGDTITEQCVKWDKLNGSFKYVNGGCNGEYGLGPSNRYHLTAKSPFILPVTFPSEWGESGYTLIIDFYDSTRYEINILIATEVDDESNESWLTEIEK